MSLCNFKQKVLVIPFFVYFLLLQISFIDNFITKQLFMFKKKQSQINIQPQRTHSPFRIQANNSQLARTPDRSNLSPMKNHTIAQQYKTKSPRKQFICEPYSAGKQMNQVRKFQMQLQNLGNQIGMEYQSGFNEKGKGYRGKYNAQVDDASYGSSINYQTTERTMKQSKKVFSNALSKMNSDKKKNGLSNQNSLFEQSKYQTQTNSVIPVDHLPIASFKALKQIKMIQSVHPLAPPPLLDKSLNRKQSQNSSNGAQRQAKQSYGKSSRGQALQPPVQQFTGEQKSKKQLIVQLINQSFSLTPSAIDNRFSQILVGKQKVLLGKDKKVMESLYIDQSLEFKELNTIISKIDGGGNPQQQIDYEAQSVKASMESAKLSLTMDPFL